MRSARPIEYEITERGCWVVTSHKPGTGGYVSATIAGQLQRLHRWAWEQASGRCVPARNHIRHSCDNPPCINPAHLLAGTAAQNIDDAIQRGRMAWGRFNPKSNLDNERVFEARLRHWRGEGWRAIASDMGVKPLVLKNAIDGRTWVTADRVGPHGERLAPASSYTHIDIDLREAGLDHLVDPCSPFWRPDGTTGGEDWTPERHGFTRRGVTGTGPWGYA